MIGDINSELKEYLDKGERLLWSGKPKSGIIFRTIDIFIIPFSIIWCGFAILWVIIASKAGLFALFGIPFVFIGLIFVFGRFIIDSKQRKNTTYGLTENRIIIKSGIFSKTIKSLDIKTLSDIELTEKGDGSGTISFGAKHPLSTFGNGMNFPGLNLNPQLEMILDARKVYRQITEIQNKK